MGKTIFLREKHSATPIFKPDAHPPYWWLRWVPAAVLAFLLLWGLYIVSRIAIIPVLASFAIAYLLNPVVERIGGLGLRRSVAALLAILLVFSALALLCWFILPDLWREGAGAGDIIFKQFSEKNAQDVRRHIQEFSPMLDQILGYKIYHILRSPKPLLDASGSWAVGSLANFFQTAAAFIDLFLVPFFVFYILVDFPDWRTQSEDLIPQRFREPFSRLFDEVGRILQSYVLGQLMIAMMMGGMYAVFLAFLRVPAWAGIAALAGLLNMVPYVGTTLGILLASGFTLAHGAGWWHVLGVVGAFVTVQCIEGYYLTPRILGGRLQLHPMAVFLGLLIFGKLFGFLGILIAVPSIAVLQVFVKFAREIYKASYFYHGGQVSPEVALSEAPEKVAKAADAVLAEQVEAESGDELLAPDKDQDDPVAREKAPR